MNQIIKQEINFKSLVQNSSKISLDIESKLIERLNETFTESQHQWYISNLFIYMNYHPINDFVVNLETIYKMIGFANKANAKRTLKNNFVLNEDYKILLIRKDEQVKTNGETGNENFETNSINKDLKGKAIIHKDVGGRPVIRKDDGKFTEETVMLNIDTFKNLCMISKTNKGKEIRKYYVKLENVYNSVIKDEIEEQKNELTKKLEEKQTQFEKEKDTITLNSFNKKNIVYFIQVDQITIKFGETSDIVSRYASHFRDYGDQIKILYVLESLDKKRLETLIKQNIYIKPRLFSKKYNNENKTELIKVDDKFNIKNIIKIAKQLNNTIDFNLPDKREFDLEIKKLEIQEIEATNKTIEANNNKMNIELEFKKLELQYPQVKEEVDNEKLTQELKEANEKILELTQELTELREWKAHRSIRNRGMKEQAEQNKEKFINWLKSNIIKDTGSFLKMDELSNKYVGHTTSTQVIKIYRGYLEEYLSINLPEVNNKYIQKAKKGCGYRDIKLK